MSRPKSLHEFCGWNVWLSFKSTDSFVWLPIIVSTNRGKRIWSMRKVYFFTGVWFESGLPLVWRLELVLFVQNLLRRFESAVYSLTALTKLTLFVMTSVQICLIGIIIQLWDIWLRCICGKQIPSLNFVFALTSLTTLSKGFQTIYYAWKNYTVKAPIYFTLFLNI